MYTLPPPLLLRHAAEGDDAFCRALYGATRDDLRQLPLPPAMIEDLIAMQYRAQEGGRHAAFPHAEVLVLDHGGVPAARMVVDAQGPQWRLVDIAVWPAMRGRGLGRALLDALQAGAAAEGAGIGLAVARTNALALRLYTRAGFTIAGTDDMHYQMTWR
jgi:GNAT superfamily N-acetyltransferase